MSPYLADITSPAAAPAPAAALAADRPSTGHARPGATAHAAGSTAHDGWSLAAALAPDTPARPEVLTPADVGGPAAFAALLRAGALVLLRAGVAVRAGLRVEPRHRAAALRGVLPPRTTAFGRTAAWVHAGGDLPATLDLAYPLDLRTPHVPAGVRVRQVGLLASDVVVLAGVRVTTPTRTALDVACLHPAAVAAPVVRRLVERSGVDLDRAARALETRTRVVGRPAARRLLDALRDHAPLPGEAC